ncbi:aldo/keto reductase [Solicola sp. PLA-1-18]|uniref:aldo/keto reductase n=1 Tax=Solicola sp. PLA-1-18 TaxID=3380532 RepID=UPI003B77DC32
MTTLGHSDIDVFGLALGTNTFGWTSDEAASHAILDAFVDGGGNLLDTADVYSAWADGHTGGESEAVIGSWLARTGRRDDVVIATKVGQHPANQGLGADTVRAAVDASLGRLQTDVVDVLYAHYDDADTPLVETLGAFQGLVEAGKVREVAISNYEPARVREWLATADAEGFRAPVLLQPQYSLLHRQEFEAERRQIALDHDLAVTPYWVLASGLLTGKYRTRADVEGRARSSMVQGYVSDAAFDVVRVLDDVATEVGSQPATVALAWTRLQPGVTAPIASASSLDQLQPLLDSVTLELDDDQLARLTKASDAVGA